MKYELKYINSYPIIKFSECQEYDDFYHLAEAIKNKLGICFSNKINDFDNLYWDFDYENGSLTIHYNIYFGVSIFPQKLKNYDKYDEQAISKIGRLMEIF